ncbi:MAG TPA: sulfite exporter TauE/SafE family protein [Micromonosporaceae bacterium]|jgi:hypothetical protein
MSVLLAAFVIVLLAAATQATTGFGFALVAVPLLATATDARTAIVTVSLIGLVLTVMIALRERAHVRWRPVAGLLAATALGMPAGLLVLAVAPERLLAVLIAIVVLGCTAMVWRGVRLRTGPGTVAGVGMVAGVLATATGVNGPPVAAAFRGMGFDPRTFRASLAAFFVGSGVAGLVGLGLTGQIHASAIALAAAGVPGVALGWWAGNWAFARMDPDRFRRSVLYALIGTSIVTLVRTAVG